MMKKIFALVLVLLMLIPLVVACKTGDGNTDTNTNTNTNTNTSTNTNTNTNTDTNTDTNVGSDKTAQEEIDAIKESFKGQTINVLASGTFSGQGDPSAPWGQAELCVPTKAELENYDPTDPEQVDPMTKGFGVAINTQLMNRKNYVETTYGVTLNYIDCRGAVMQTRLRTAAGNTDIGGEVIHIAMPRVLEAQAIVIDQSVYDFNGSKFIDFDASYYNQEALDAYTLADRTFFLAGDISFLDEQTAHLIFYNMAIAKENQAFPDLYEYALNGTWTIDTLYTLASAVSYNADGIDGYSDNDKYGLGTRGLSAFYQYFGVYQVSKKDSVDGEIYYLSVRDDKVSTIIDQMIKAKKNESYIRTDWDGDYVAMQAAFEDNRLLFYHEVIQKLDYLGKKPDLQVGILPFPKLNVQQERYYSPSASQSTLICIPRATDDRDMSEAFVEILSSSASRYVMPAYYDMVESNLYAEFAEQSMRVLKEQIFPNMMYDQGYMFEYGGLVSGSIQGSSIDGNVNNFESAYANGFGAAEDKIAEWNTAYGSYTDEI
jgi:hypothetical protein